MPGINKPCPQAHQFTAWPISQISPWAITKSWNHTIDMLTLNWQSHHAAQPAQCSYLPPRPHISARTLLPSSKVSWPEFDDHRGAQLSSFPGVPGNQHTLALLRGAAGLRQAGECNDCLTRQVAPAKFAALTQPIIQRRITMTCYHQNYSLTAYAPYPALPNRASMPVRPDTHGPLDMPPCVLEGPANPDILPPAPGPRCSDSPLTFNIGSKCKSAFELAPAIFRVLIATPRGDRHLVGGFRLAHVD
ncbi:hypothetical protein BD779DRAFT_1786940 [Infundibulicybe gibba]|nr:hypothetical protein BD779DRAFT_1786940 [Infundibulicybe gibba]